jgi:DHA3 family tetracycline resistance protein-like MFS transporter
MTRLLFVMSGLQIGTVIALGLAPSFVIALGAYWGYAILRSMVTPLYTTWVTLNTDSKVRATVISLSGQIDAIGQIAGGPVVGVVGTLVSIRAAIVAAGALLSPSLLFFARALRQGKEDVQS